MGWDILHAGLTCSTPAGDFTGQEITTIEGPAIATIAQFQRIGYFGPERSG